MYRHFKYRLYPNKQQENAMNETLFTCSLLYNRCLAERHDAWQNEHRSVNRHQQNAMLPQLKKEEQRYAKVNAQVLQDTVTRVDRAFKAFFRRMKSGEKPGYPRFKSARRYDSFTYPFLGNGIKITGNKLRLQHIGSVRIVFHRPLEGMVKTCTIHRQVDSWYACFSCEVDPKVVPATDMVVGVDLGVESFAVTSDERFFPSNKSYRKAEKKLKKQQRELSRKQPGSNRRKKAKKQLSKTSLHVANQRNDNAHKVARELVNQYQLIAIEDLNVTGMMKNHHLAKAIQDQGWSTFVNILMSKAEEAGRKVVKVNPAYTSQECSECGKIQPKKLSDRWHSCDCGCELHRDVNAARNILRKALQQTA
jgi:putative transposase